MIYNDSAYYTGYYRNVRALGAIPALVFDTIVGLLRTNPSGEIATSTIQELLGVKDKRTISNAINDLINAGWIERTEGNGPGKKSIYTITEKGAKNVPFAAEKGYKKCTERVQKMQEKGAKIPPLNKELNKELKEREETPTPTKVVMEDFNLFCELYPVDPDWSNQKESCERVWWAMSKEWKDKIITQLQNNQRWRLKKNDNPYWYLKDYAGQDAQMDLPFVKNGNAQIDRWIREGKQVCVMMYQEGDWSGCIYCLGEDREKMESVGAKYLRMM